MKLPSPSMFVSVAALVVAASGTSYAVASIGSADIRNNSIRSLDVKNESLLSRDVRDGALRARDFAPGQLPKGAQGDMGPAGIGRWALVDREAGIVAQSGGFEVRSGYDIVNNTGAPVPGGAVGNVYLDANEDLSDNGIVVSIALQNKLDQNNDTVLNGRAGLADGNPEFSGEITATKCNIPSVVACAPVGADNDEHLVVSPRMSDGTVTVTGDGTAANPNTHKRFYVVITGDSSDYVAPAA
ncbi:hypothetical protein [Nocardioides lijunqiniae]|uniref:hypothetical protein n=1 Tax=Nocardioides lijunqiniae TaxID=2760832 RepID=UPI001878D5E6|nr:hypothetical protein [Nocardioides lijunqiniae]